MENKKQNKELDLQKYLAALRDPVIGPKIKAYIRSTDSYKAMISKGRSK